MLCAKMPRASTPAVEMTPPFVIDDIAAGAAARTAAAERDQAAADSARAAAAADALGENGVRALAVVEMPPEA